MDLSPNQMLRLAPNKVDYLIPGGEMINEFLGEGPGARVCSQMWIASLVTSASSPALPRGCPGWRGRTFFCGTAWRKTLRPGWERLTPRTGGSA